MKNILSKLVLAMAILLSIISEASPRAVALRCQQYMQRPAAERAFDCAISESYSGFLFMRKRFKVRPPPAEEALYLELRDAWIYSSYQVGAKLRVVSSFLWKSQADISFLEDERGRIVSGEFDSNEAKAFWRKFDGQK